MEKATYFIFGLWVFLCMSTLVSACEVSSKSSVLTAENEQYVVALTPNPTKIKVSEPFQVNLQICRTDGEPFMGQIKVDARMPGHGHGMNYRPEITANTQNSFVGEGFIFHMLGKWQIEFRVMENNKTSKLTIDYHLK